jgi:uncharacterized membrane protein (GlpM family)
MIEILSEIKHLSWFILIPSLIIFGLIAHNIEKSEKNLEKLEKLKP